MKEKNVDLKIGSLLKFLLPSLAGILFLMIPFSYQGETTIGVALLAGQVQDLLGGSLQAIVVFLIALSALGSLLYYLIQPAASQRPEFIRRFFDQSLFWTLARLLGLVIALMVYFQWGPAWLWSEDTGGLILNDLILGLFSIFLIAGFFLPLLTDFGLLEFVGVLLTPVMRPLFDLPGRASIDCVASWIGDGTIGVSLTSRQYEEGYYTSKEAAIIATTFSAVSITFSLVVLKQVDLVSYFGPYYLTIILAGLVAAIILPKLPPLSKKSSSYYKGSSKGVEEQVPVGHSGWSWGLTLALDKAEKSFNLKDYVSRGLMSVLDLWLGVLPVIMAFGSLALVLAEFTPVFKWLGLPFLPLLKLLQLPFAEQASQTMMVGFADMFLPSVIAASIPSELTRFVIAALSVTQLIYLSEAGAVMLGSKIDVSLKDLFVIFILRTLVTLPIIALVGHLIF